VFSTPSTFASNAVPLVMVALCQALIAEVAEFHSSTSWAAKILFSSLLGPVGTSSTSIQVDAVFDVLVAILFLAIQLRSIRVLIDRYPWKLCELCDAVMSHSSASFLVGR